MARFLGITNWHVAKITFSYRRGAVRHNRKKKGFDAMFKNDASARPEIDITDACSYFEPHMVAFAISVSGEL